MIQSPLLMVADVFTPPLAPLVLLAFFIGDPFGPETVIIGHENSPLHKKAYFALEPGSAEAR